MKWPFVLRSTLAALQERFDRSVTWRNEMTGRAEKYYDEMEAAKKSAATWENRAGENKRLLDHAHDTIDALGVDVTKEYDKRVEAEQASATYKSYADTMTYQRDAAVATAARADARLEDALARATQWAGLYETLLTKYQQLRLVGAQETPLYPTTPAKERDPVIGAINQRANGDQNLRGLMLQAMQRDRRNGKTDGEILAEIETGVDGASDGLPL